MKSFVAAVGIERVFCFASFAALILGITSSSALAQMKEGTYSGTYSGFGTAKATPIGKDRLLVAVDETGFTLTNGFLDHVTWHCWGHSGLLEWHGPNPRRLLRRDRPGRRSTGSHT
jgi:hypothetical protein